jgi:hypothetical protein
MYLRKTEAKYFSIHVWTVDSALNRLTNFVFSRNDFSPERVV